MKKVCTYVRNTPKKVILVFIIKETNYLLSLSICMKMVGARDLRGAAHHLAIVYQFIQGPSCGTARQQFKC